MGRKNRAYYSSNIHISTPTFPRHHKHLSGLRTGKVNPPKEYVIIGTNRDNINSRSLKVPTQFSPINRPSPALCFHWCCFFLHQQEISDGVTSQVARKTWEFFALIVKSDHIIMTEKINYKWIHLICCLCLENFLDISINKTTQKRANTIKLHHISFFHDDDKNPLDFRQKISTYLRTSH